MPRSSWGTKTKVGKNKWRIRWCEWNGRNRVRKSKTLYPCTSRDADNELRRLWQLHHLRPEERGVPCPTFSQCWDDWRLPDMREKVEKGKLSPSTLKNQEKAWRVNIEPRWGRILMDSVTPDEYQRWLDGMTHSTARAAHIVVTALVTSAKMHGVKGITFKDVSYKMPRKPKEKELSVYTLDEMEELLRTLHGSPCEPVAILMAKGSCRVGEAVAASVDDISFEEYSGRLYAVYDLHRQYAQDGVGFTALKTEDSRRPIVVPEPWSKRLKEIVAEKVENEELFLCDSGAGVPMPRSTLRRIWRELFTSGELRLRNLPMSKLRNSWATAMLWKYGVPAQMVDKMMGHAPKDVLGKNYDRPDKQMFIETVDTALFGK